MSGLTAMEIARLTGKLSCMYRNLETTSAAELFAVAHILGHKKILVPNISRALEEEPLEPEVQVHRAPTAEPVVDTGTPRGSAKEQTALQNIILGVLQNCGKPESLIATIVQHQHDYSEGQIKYAITCLRKNEKIDKRGNRNGIYYLIGDVPPLSAEELYVEDSEQWLQDGEEDFSLETQQALKFFRSFPDIWYKAGDVAAILVKNSESTEKVFCEAIFDLGHRKQKLSVMNLSKKIGAKDRWAYRYVSEL